MRHSADGPRSLPLSLRSDRNVFFLQNSHGCSFQAVILSGLEAKRVCDHQNGRSRHRHCRNQRRHVAKDCDRQAACPSLLWANTLCEFGFRLDGRPRSLRSSRRLIAACASSIAPQPRLGIFVLANSTDKRRHAPDRAQGEQTATAEALSSSPPCQLLVLDNCEPVLPKARAFSVPIESERGSRFLI